MFFGTWGTNKQCARRLIKPGGSVKWEPFEINGQWLRQGNTWCSLNWGPLVSKADGFFTMAYARCGEDAVRSYLLGLELNEDKLKLRWNFPRMNGPLMRCASNNR